MATIRHRFDTKDIKLGGSSGNDRAKSIRALFERYYDNNVVVIALEQQGNYGKVVNVAAMVDLSNMNKKTLRFYNFDIRSNKFMLVDPQPRFWIDEEKYLRFDTFYAGDIVITDKPLKRKG